MAQPRPTDMPRPAKPRPSRRRRLLRATGIVASPFALLALVAAIGAWDNTDAGHVAVVRNGGPANSNIRRIIDPSSGVTWTGLWSTTHMYPAQQRFYTITSDANAGDKVGVDVVQTPSSDGVDMGIEGTLYFSLNLDHKILTDFDNKFGTRTYTEGGKSYHAYNSDEGWSVFLDQVIRPVIDNDLREQVASFPCAQLVSSCALVRNSTNSATLAPVATSGNGNIAAVQKAINDSLPNDLAATLGDQFLTDIHFNLVRITLPPNVQTAVNDAQAAYAAVSESQAKVVQAQADAAANEARQKGYDSCPTCAQIDELKALPSGVTVFAPGSGTGLPLTGVTK